MIFEIYDIYLRFTAIMYWLYWTCIRHQTVKKSVLLGTWLSLKTPWLLLFPPPLSCYHFDHDHDHDIRYIDSYSTALADYKFIIWKCFLDGWFCFFHGGEECGESNILLISSHMSFNPTKQQLVPTKKNLSESNVWYGILNKIGECSKGMVQAIQNLNLVPLTSCKYENHYWDWIPPTTIFN